MSRLDLVPTGYVRHQKFITKKGDKRYACLVNVHSRPHYLCTSWRTATQADIYGEAVMFRYIRMRDKALVEMAKEATAKPKNRSNRNSVSRKSSPVLTTGRRTSNVQEAK
jgi:hypothetical protein